MPGGDHLTGNNAAGSVMSENAESGTVRYDRIY
jgi:hypothetical protein